MSIARSFPRKVLGVLLVVALLAAGAWVRLGLVERLGQRTNAQLGFDAYNYYVSAAESLLEGRGLDPAYNHRGPYSLFFVPPPMTSWFIALVYRLDGAHDLLAVYRTQCAINLLAGLWLAWLLYEWAGAGAAFLGLAGWMVYPEFFALVQEPLSESNYFIFMAAALWLVARWTRARATAWAVAAAVLIGLMNLQRPSGLFMGAPLAAYALVRIAGRRRWLHAAILLGAPFLVLTPWMIRNWRMNGDPVWVSSNGGLLFYAVNHLGYDPIQYPDYGRYPAELWQVKALEDRFWSAEFEGHRTAYRKSGLYMAEARRYIVHHPLDFVRINLIKFVQRFVLMPNVFGQVYPWMPLWLARVIFYGLLALGWAGLAFPFSAWRHPTHQTLAICFAYYIWFITLLHYSESGRLTAPLRVFLLLFAAMLISRLRRKRLPSDTIQAIRSPD